MGAGKRVRNDILPALKAIGISEKDLLIVRKNYATLDDFPKIKVITDYKFLELEDIAKNIILISSIPQSDTITALSKFLKIITPKAVLIDTPIFDIAKYVQAAMNEHGIEINILEDGGLIPWLNVFNQTKLVSIDTETANNKIYFSAVYLEKYETIKLDTLNDIVWKFAHNKFNDGLFAINTINK